MRTQVAKAVPVTPVVAASEKPITPPPAIEDANVKVVTRDGWLRPAAGLFKKPGSHQLMSSDKPAESALLCFMSSTSTNLDQYEGKRVRITGGEYWQRGWNQPLIRVTNVELVK